MDTNKKPNLEYVYYWYHHMYISFAEQERIIQCINEHDFDSFLQFYLWYQKNTLNNPEGWCYFPDTITVFNKDKLEIVELLPILDKENFNKIQFTECECG